MKIPLAWRQLTHDKTRLLVALAGIAFADVLMFMQLGFRDALFESAVTFHKQLQGDVFLISTQSTALIAMRSFSSRRLYQTLSFDGVASAEPLFLDTALWKNPQTQATRGMMVIGFNPERSLMTSPGLEGGMEKTKIPDIVLFDAASRPEFGPVPDLFKQGETVETEVRSRRVRVGGLFTLGASFGADGNLITSDLNFLRIFPTRSKDLIDVGVVRLKPGVDPIATVAAMRQEFASDVKILTKEEFVEFERSYWEQGTSIGFIFTLGTAMGFIVGIVIVYQILYTDVSDHLPEYATLKAMGYSDWYLLGVVFQEAVILAFLGYIPGGLVTFFLYDLTRNATSLPLYMTLARAITVLVLTLIMCLVSGAISVRKLQAADPADIF
ncbi:MAG: FtsX-like permease family protein [Coleofasciculaceae cyanobacterium SM2_1_6]|nr:FtsX-like permease family protein [Coleofasciculaceae cyanobacterium SM2_1_6]